MSIVPPPSNPNEKQPEIPGVTAVPPSAADSALTAAGQAQEPLEVLPVMSWWVRGALVGVALILAGVFTIAALLNPYNADGSPRRMATHTTWGLPPCTFYQVTGKPCPSCGMTTSFALTIRGDLFHAVQANFVGCLLALTCLLAVPWCVLTAIRQKPLFIRSVERVLIGMVIGLLCLMLVRWVIVLGLIWWLGYQPPM